MLTSINLRDFQGHERLHLQLDKGVNTIVGPSDVGKSAVIRALQWVCFNRPRGDSIIRDGSAYAVVTLQADGYQVTRRRGRVNAYSLQQRGEAKVNYQAFGADVPEAIEDLLNVDATNFQSQHDAPFWFALSPGQVSRALNAVVDLGVIDSTLSKLSSAQRTAKTTVTITEDQVRKAKAAVLEYSNTPAMDRDLARVELRFSQYDAAAHTRRSLGITAKKVSVHRLRLRMLKARRTQARKLVKLGAAALAAAGEVETLSDLQKQLACDDDVKPVDFTPVRFRKARCVVAERNLTELLVLNHKLNQATAQQRQAATMVKASLDMIEKQCEGVCPLCQQSLL